MKIKEALERIFWYLCITVVVIISLPLLRLYLIFKLITMPFDYMKYKKSLYQRDFPQKYKWLSTPHADNDVYTIIKENNLPVEYIKWCDYYEVRGYFVYKNILLCFDEPIIFDKNKGVCFDLDEDVNDKFECEADSDSYEDNTIEGIKALMLDDFHKNVPGRECDQILFFYSRKTVEKFYKKGSSYKMRALDGFVIYEKSELLEVLKEIIDTH